MFSISFTLLFFSTALTIWYIFVYGLYISNLLLWKQENYVIIALILVPKTVPGA